MEEGPSASGARQARRRSRSQARTVRRPGRRRAGPAAGRKPAPKQPRRPVRVRREPSAALRGALETLSLDLVWRRPASAAPRAPERVPFRPLHVVMAGWEFPPLHSGGLGVHCYELVRELTAVGHRVTFLTPFTGPFTEVPGVAFRSPTRPAAAGVPADAYARVGVGTGSGDGWDMTRYNDWIAGLPGLRAVDIVHVHDWFGTVGAAALARRLDVPLVMTMHSTEYDRSLGHPWEPILERERYGLRAADRVIAVSRHLKRQLVERYGVPAEKVRVIYNAVRPPERLERLEPARPFVLFLGRLAAMKGVDTFLRAAARVAATDPEVQFVVAGEGPEYPRLLALAAHLGIPDRVLFLGRVDEEERSALLARATVFVLPSVVEPFGIAALEAMAAGVPTILSKTSGVAEVTENVFAVDFWDIDEFANRMAELLAYPELRKTMGALGRLDATRNGWAERALETVGVYAELLKARAGRRA